MNGTIILSWIESGRKFRQDTKGSVGSAGQQQSFETWTIGDGVQVFTHAPGMGKQVMRAKVPKSGGAGGPTGMTPFGGTHGGGAVIGKATILGKPCEIRKIGQGQGQGKVWLWKGLLMRMEMSGPQGGGMKMLATRLEESPKLSPALFKVPAGYQMKEFQMPSGRPGGAGPGPR
jgi:hypothetical protein